MKQVLITLFLLKVLLPHALLYATLRHTAAPDQATIVQVPDSHGNDLAKQVLEILNAKCNICHRKQNPFKVFSSKNMEKHAPKIYEQVFVKQRMPKGDEINLTAQEVQLLKKWLKSQNLF